MVPRADVPCSPRITLSVEELQFCTEPVSLYNRFILVAIQIFKIQYFQIHHKRLLFFFFFKVETKQSNDEFFCKARNNTLKPVIRLLICLSWFFAQTSECWLFLFLKALSTSDLTSSERAREHGESTWGRFMRLFFDLKLKSVGRVIEVRVGFDWGPLLAQGGGRGTGCFRLIAETAPSRA